MDHSSEFSPFERSKLEGLRAKYRTGQWPLPVDLSFATRHCISMNIETVRSESDRLFYRCQLNRTVSDSSRRHFETLFQVTAAYPEEPGIDEVLRWLATTTAHVNFSANLEEWALLHGLTENGGHVPHPYRGLVRDSLSVDRFLESILRESAQFRNFLGPEAYAEILMAVNAL